MRTQLVIATALCLLAIACGSSQSSNEGSSSGAGSSGGGATGSGEPIVIDPPATSQTGPIVVGTDTCATDADCVVAACCHATSCVARANAPSCADVMCTADCREGTTDCGGGCLCQDGHCAARLWQMDTPTVQ
ncbi:MAG: hypothetical protein U0353_09785 [Sandaracinus sp.]